MGGSFWIFPDFALVSSGFNSFGFSLFVFLKTHFGLGRGFRQVFARDEPCFPFFGKGFDLVFAPKGRRVIGLGFLKDQLHRPVGGRIFASLARIVGFNAFFDVFGDTGVITSIRTFGDIKGPAFGGKPFFLRRRTQFRRPLE